MSNCPICLDTIIDKAELGCSHIFCFKCIVAWVASGTPSDAHSKCPFCRVTIIELVGQHQIFFPQEQVSSLVYGRRFMLLYSNATEDDILLFLNNKLGRVHDFYCGIDMDEVCTFLFDLVMMDFEFIKNLV